MLVAIFTVLPFALMLHKGGGGQTAAALIQSMALAPGCTSSHAYFTAVHGRLKKKKKPVFFHKNVPGKAV